MRMTIGRFVIIVLLLAACFDFIVYLLGIFVQSQKYSVGEAYSVLNVSKPVFSYLEPFFVNTFNWCATILTTAIAVAVLIFISLLYEALEARWR